jgi:hypothetical protein
VVDEISQFKVALAAALAQGDDGGAVSRVCGALAEALPCDGVAVTLMMSDMQRNTVFASDDVIASFEDAQYTLGEGPSLVALTESRPVLVLDFANPSSAARWPGLAQEIATLPTASVFCFPMRFGVINVGICAFYRRRAGPLSATEISFVLDALELTMLVLLQLRGGGDGESLVGRWLAVDGYSRRRVHQATGMLMGQLGVSAESAFARLRGRAFAEGTGIEQIADDIVNRGLLLEPDPARRGGDPPGP